MKTGLPRGRGARALLEPDGCGRLPETARPAPGRQQGRSGAARGRRADPLPGDSGQRRWKFEEDKSTIKRSKR